MQLLVEELFLGEPVLEWRFKRQKPLRLLLPSLPQPPISPVTILDIKNTGPLKNDLIVGWGNYVLSGPIDLYPQGESP